jgi:hypothetical protein
MRFLFCTFLGLVATAISGCGKRETPAEEGVRTRTLLVGNAAEPGDLDPHLASILNDQIVVLALFEGLTLLDERTTNPLPAAAESWQVSPDGLVWTFRLRDGLQWSNGDPLTADDFIGDAPIVPRSVDMANLMAARQSKQGQRQNDRQLLHYFHRVPPAEHNTNFMDETGARQFIS